MADYTNYSFVSWTDATPITSVRLNQMSVNIDQVKIVNDDKPKGILKLRDVTDNPVATGDNKFVPTKIAGLEQETIGNVGVDNRVTLDSSRFYKLTLTLPAIQQDQGGGEDSLYYLRFRTGNTANSGSILTTFVLAPPVGVYRTLIANTTISNGLAFMSPIVFGAGTYTYVFRGTASNNQSHIAELERVTPPTGTANLASGWTVLASSGRMQFYIEDIGGIG
jgi:hypothetical protein